MGEWWMRFALSHRPLQHCITTTCSRSQNHSPHQLAYHDFNGGRHTRQYMGNIGGCDASMCKMWSLLLLADHPSTTHTLHSTYSTFCQLLPPRGKLYGKNLEHSHEKNPKKSEISQKFHENPNKSNKIRENYKGVIYPSVTSTLTLFQLYHIYDVCDM